MATARPSKGRPRRTEVKTSPVNLPVVESEEGGPWARGNNKQRVRRNIAISKLGCDQIRGETHHDLGGPAVSTDGIWSL